MTCTFVSLHRGFHFLSFVLGRIYFFLICTMFQRYCLFQMKRTDFLKLNEGKLVSPGKKHLEEVGTLGFASVF